MGIFFHIQKLIFPIVKSNTNSPPHHLLRSLLHKPFNSFSPDPCEVLQLHTALELQSAPGCRLAAGLWQQRKKAAASPGPKSSVHQGASLARRGDSSLHAEVCLPTSAVPLAVPAAEGQLLGFGSWAHQLQGGKEMLPIPPAPLPGLRVQPALCRDAY